MAMIDGWKRVMEVCDGAGIKPTNRALLVSIERQTMQFFADGELVKAYVVSTSRRPPSNVKGSLGTPRGLHTIGDKIGAGQPPGIVFKARVATGYHFTEHIERGGSDENLITTRILWLKGGEPGINQGGEVDTYDRYVYIHGTNREDMLGRPASAGCVQMANMDIIELFDQVRTGDPVLIVD